MTQSQVTYKNKYLDLYGHLLKICPVFFYRQPGLVEGCTTVSEFPNKLALKL